MVKVIIYSSFGYRAEAEGQDEYWALLKAIDMLSLEALRRKPVEDLQDTDKDTRDRE